MFDHISIKEALKRESGQKWSIIKQYEPLWRDMTIYGHITHRISNTDQFSASAPEKAAYELCRHLVEILHNMASTGPVLPGVGNGAQL